MRCAHFLGDFARAAWYAFAQLVAIYGHLVFVCLRLGAWLCWHSWVSNMISVAPLNRSG